MISDKVARTCWDRFVTWYKKPFRLDLSLEKNNPNYYTAIYSSSIEKFKDLFTLYVVQ